MKPIIIFTSCLFLTACNPAVFFQKVYYKAAYKPEKIKKTKGSFQAEHFITGVPCISYDNAYCASASLQMVGHQKGQDSSIHYYNWLMGFTYGAFFAGSTFVPYNDPETGFIQASPPLSMERRFLTTKDKGLFITTVKTLLSTNNALRVSVNSPTLSGQEGFSPHSVLLTGYTPDYVYYYETGGKDTLMYNTKGDSAKWEVFLKSQEILAERLHYPWQYNLLLLTENKNKSANICGIWKKNALSLIGAKKGFVSTGAVAISNLATYLENQKADEKKWQQSIAVLEAAAYTRKDNSNYLKRNFHKNPELSEAAELLASSAENFEQVTNIIKSGKRDVAELTPFIRKSAEAEKKAGDLMLKYSELNCKTNE